MPLFCFFLLLSPYCLTHADSPPCWEYSINGDTEETARNYILIYHESEKKEFRKISVTSKCKRPWQGEGSYGECSHRVLIEPGGKGFSLNSGEDVIQISIPETYPYLIPPPLILGTIEYGCCLNPDVVRYYTENGEYLGKAERFELHFRGRNSNIFTRRFDIGNIYYDRMKNLVLLSDEKVPNQFQVLKIEKGKIANRIPVVLKDFDPSICETWHAQRFEETPGGKGIDLDLRGSWCKTEGFQERRLMCHDSPELVICTDPAKAVSEEKPPAVPKTP